MTIKQQLLQDITSVLKKLGINDIAPKIDYPTDSKHGDFSSNVAMIAAKKLGKKPMELAEEIAAKVRGERGEGKGIERVEVAGPGFVNFWIADGVLLNHAADIATDGITFTDLGKKRKVVVEYSSPNIAKPFTVGHLRSTIIGDAVANLMHAIGYDVYRDNHIGDWGTQFGKQIFAIKTWGNEDEIKKSDRPVKILVDLYVKFHEEAEKDPKLEDEAREWFKKLEDGDSEARELWEKCIEWSWKEFNQIYKELDVPTGKLLWGERIDFENNGRGYGEAFFEHKMEAVIRELREKKLLQRGKDGAQLVFFPNDKYPPLMILKKDGATLYSTRDLATDKFRLEHYGKDVLIINEVGVEQSLYFKQLYELEVMLGWIKSDQRVHIKHGHYRFQEGKMSTRKGNVIWLEEVLEEAKKRALKLANEAVNYEGSASPSLEKRKKLTKQRYQEYSNNTEALDKRVSMIAYGAIKWNDLKRSPEQDITFDWNDTLNMQGNSGPYMQYAFVRTQSVLRKGRGERGKGRGKADLKLEIEERDLLRLLSRFEDIVEEAAVRYSPNVLTTYLFELAQAFNLFYQKHQIIKPSSAESSGRAGGEEDVKNFRLKLTKATGTVLQKGLHLLGIQAPQSM